MQSDNENNVLSIFDQPKKESITQKKDTKEEFDFEAIMKKNMNNSGRQARERSKSNRGVIRSYRLKH